VWELIVQGGIDPVTGRYRQVSRVFHGNLRDAKKARAELLVEAGNGSHTGMAAGGGTTVVRSSRSTGGVLAPLPASLRTKP
jgi:hypothetical protein